MNPSLQEDIVVWYPHLQALHAHFTWLCGIPVFKMQRTLNNSYFAFRHISVPPFKTQGKCKSISKTYL